ncbi:MULTISPECIES: hypothetical protein [Streptomyces]|uniref:hypothetical protein n=1 Tax=Streptomyces TaxID=1883 RepID=UPI002E3331F8|nr:hypothetical protein [Streptomyces canus]WSZ34904.1 hypothetical protein OG806_38440 [Streptomyces sp. NBC_00882]
MLSSERQLDLSCAVDNVLAGSCNLADRGAVGKEDEAVVATVVDVALNALAHSGE